MQLIGVVIDFVLWACVVVLIARFVIDWVQVLARSWRPRGMVLIVCEAVYTVTDPPLRLGAVALDLSPMVLLIALWILQAINRTVFF